MIGLIGLATLWTLAGGSAAAQEDEPVYTITVLVQDRGEGERIPIAGVTVSISDASGTELESAETDAQGRVSFEVTGRQDYTVRLDTSTLPDGLAVEEGRDELRITSASLTSTSLSRSFFTGEGAATGESFVNRFAQRFVDGTRFGLLIAITSVGLSLIFGTTGLTNFAHGEMVTFGALIAFLLNVTGLTFLAWLPFVASDGTMPMFVSAVIAVIVGGLFGVLLNAGIFGPLRRRGFGLVTQMVISVGLSIALKNFFLQRFGGRRQPYAAFANQRAWEIGPIAITPRDLFISITSLIVLVAVALLLQRTRLGKATRAVSDNANLASATGINSEGIIKLVWFVGGALAALGGIFVGLDEQVSFEMGAQLLFVMFAGITLGGLGSAFGALLGGFLVGLFVELSTLSSLVAPELKNAPALLVLILVLLVRPQGILGRAERVG
jgi:neutral amino acid transport system permease protein